MVWTGRMGMCAMISPAVRIGNDRVRTVTLYDSEGEQMTIKVISGRLSQQELKRLAQETYGEMIKALVDIKRDLLAVGGELHADAKAILLDQSSRQENLWGINLYPDKSKADRIEYTALINVRPGQGNLSMEVKSPSLRRKIREIVNQRIDWGDST